MSDVVKFYYEGDPKHLAGLLFGLLPTSARPPLPEETPTFQAAEQHVPVLSMLRPTPVLVPEPDDVGTPASTPEVDLGLLDSMSMEAQVAARPDFDFSKIPLEPEAWDAFVSVVRAWAVNFDGPVDEKGVSTTPQPNRMALLESIGRGRWPLFVLRWLAHYTCTQKAIMAALPTEDKDLADRISANILQLSHAAFPDIAGFHDHSTRWMRT